MPANCSVPISRRNERIEMKEPRIWCLYVHMYVCGDQEQQACSGHNIRSEELASFVKLIGPHAWKKNKQENVKIRNEILKI